MNSTQIQSRIDATNSLILVYETAALALGTDNTQSYKLDTGQTVTWVTKLDLDMLNRTLDTLYNRCAMLEARLNGKNGVTVSPAW